MARTPINYLLALSLATAAGAAVAAPAKPAAAGTAAKAVASSTANLPGTVLDQVVAVANDQPILQSSLNDRLAQV
ncbi:MAG TPA: hypothetical protein VFA48_01170, partial [Gammaproteobacteria bacterium]|nr:hypothetical protein [Gammaproteobacteria bacterium]